MPVESSEVLNDEVEVQKRKIVKTALKRRGDRNKTNSMVTVVEEKKTRICMDPQDLNQAIKKRALSAEHS